MENLFCEETFPLGEEKADSDKDVPDPEVEYAVTIWRGMKTVLFPILQAPDPASLWEDTRSKIWSLYESAGFPYEPTDRGFWKWLLEQNHKVSSIRAENENIMWEQGLNRLKKQLLMPPDPDIPT